MTAGRPVSGARKSLSLLARPTADRLAWQAATSPGRDIFDDAGLASHWAASTRTAVQYDYGRWLGYVAMWEPNALALAPGARASKERLVGFLGHLGETVGSVGQHSTIRHLRDALVAMLPGWDRTWLDRLVFNQLEATIRDWRRGYDDHCACPRTVFARSQSRSTSGAKKPQKWLGRVEK